MSASPHNRSSPGVLAVHTRVVVVHTEAVRTEVGHSAVRRVVHMVVVAGSRRYCSKGRRRRRLDGSSPSKGIGIY